MAKTVAKRLAKKVALPKVNKLEVKVHPLHIQRTLPQSRPRLVRRGRGGRVRVLPPTPKDIFAGIRPWQKVLIKRNKNNKLQISVKKCLRAEDILKQFIEFKDLHFEKRKERRQDKAYTFLKRLQSITFSRLFNVSLRRRENILHKSQERQQEFLKRFNKLEDNKETCRVIDNKRLQESYHRLLNQSAIKAKARKSRAEQKLLEPELPKSKPKSLGRRLDLWESLIR
jgi:hypothetical protein